MKTIKKLFNKFLSDVHRVIKEDDTDKDVQNYFYDIFSYIPKDMISKIEMDNFNFGKDTITLFTIRKEFTVEKRPIDMRYIFNSPTDPRNVNLLCGVISLIYNIKYDETIYNENILSIVTREGQGINSDKVLLINSFILYKLFILGESPKVLSEAIISLYNKSEKIYKYGVGDDAYNTIWKIVNVSLKVGTKPDISAAAGILKLLFTQHHESMSDLLLRDYIYSGVVEGLNKKYERDMKKLKQEYDDKISGELSDIYGVFLKLQNDGFLLNDKWLIKDVNIRPTHVYKNGELYKITNGDLYVKNIAIPLSNLWNISSHDAKHPNISLNGAICIGDIFDNVEKKMGNYITILNMIIESLAIPNLDSCYGLYDYLELSKC